MELFGTLLAGTPAAAFAADHEGQLSRMHDHVFEGVLGTICGHAPLGAKDLASAAGPCPHYGSTCTAFSFCMICLRLNACMRAQHVGGRLCMGCMGSSVTRAARVRGMQRRQLTL
eukprot:111199-Pelagomonas_calceolata.AAC.4